MIFFILCLASGMLSYSVVHAGLVLCYLAKSEIPHPIYKLNRSPPEISIMILHRRRRKQQEQQQNKTEIVAGLT